MTVFRTPKFQHSVTVAATALLVACGAPTAPSQDTQGAVPTHAASLEKSADASFEAQLDAHWAWVLSTAPTFATSLGVRTYDDQLSDPSLAAYDAQVERQTEFLRAFKAVDADSLRADNQLNLQLMVRELETSIEAATHNGRYLFITNRAGPHTTITGMVSRLPFNQPADYESYLARLNAAPDYLAKATRRLRSGIQAGWVQPCAPMTGYDQTIRTHIVDDVSESVLMDAFDARPTGVSAADFSEYKGRAEAVIQDNVIPALEEFEQFYLDEYAPSCRADVGLSSIDGGQTITTIWPRCSRRPS